MENPVPMLSVAQAKQQILEKFNLLDSEIIPAGEAMGRILASSCFAEFDLPPFQNSAMDGFAIQSQDVSNASEANPAHLKVVGDIPAGYFATQALESGQAMRIMTGAAVPEGADAVVPVEETDIGTRSTNGQLPESVTIYKPVMPGAAIRPKGQDIRRGETVLESGKQLRPQELGMLSMLGVVRVPVVRKPHVAIFSSGDEIVQTGAPLPPGKIYDSNSSILSALIAKAGGEALFLGVARDELAEVRNLFESAESLGVDLIVSSAGVSVGAFDFVRSVVEQNGGLHFWRVNMRPGKPVAFGNFRGIPFFGLPGNPVSAFVSFELFVKPALHKMMGLQDEPIRIKVRLNDAIESDGRESYLRAVLDFSKQTARLTGHQGSGNLRSLVQANALIIIPSAVKSLPAGSEVDAWLLDA